MQIILRKNCTNCTLSRMADARSSLRSASSARRTRWARRIGALAEPLQKARVRQEEQVVSGTHLVQAEARTACPAFGEDSPEPYTLPPGLRFPVLVGYSGSQSSRRALAYAMGIAGRLGRPLVVVYVSRVHFSPMSGQVIVAPTKASEIAGWLFGSGDWTHYEGRRFLLVLRGGDPARELAGAAARYGADVLVIGASGRWRRLMTGSVSGPLARHPRCPVIVVP